MIKKLQRRFIFITMAGISLIFILILLVLNISVGYSARRQGYAILYQYDQRRLAPENFPENISPMFSPDKEGFDDQHFHADNGGERPDMNWFNNMRVLYVNYDAEGSVSALSTGGNPDMTEETLISMAEKVLKDPHETGKQSGYLYLFRENEGQTSIYFLDYYPEKDMSMRLFRICLWVGLAGIVALFIPVIFLSKWVVKPVQLAFDKQKQFIADASHELKTPLTIITTNAEVLTGALPNDKWLGHILDQSARMKVLINSLLELARLDAYSSKQAFIPFDMSKTVKNAALSFESIAYEYGKSFHMEIQEGLLLLGNETNIRELTTILLDNAFKYSNENGTISIRLSTYGDKKELQVHNTGKGISASDQKRIFERFYRSDASRSRESGGYGLGLSIAESIVKVHKGHISVKSDGQSYSTFTVIFS